MTGKISLTASMRSNLLSLQNISRQVSSTQNKLATGNKVNSAIDNPSSYYTARSLTNRANDLDSLLDSMGQAGRTFHLTRVMPLDILFPPSFMLFMFCWLSLLLQKTTKSNSKFCLIALLPPVYMLLDWTENIGITAMLMKFPERLNKICVATGIITSVKKTVVLLVIISYIILLAALLIKINRGKNNAKTER